MADSDRTDTDDDMDSSISLILGVELGLVDAIKFVSTRYKIMYGAVDLVAECPNYETDECELAQLWESLKDNGVEEANLVLVRNCRGEYRRGYVVDLRNDCRVILGREIGARAPAMRFGVDGNYCYTAQTAAAALSAEIRELSDLLAPIGAVRLHMGGSTWG
uniref:Uncharacterized protein n=1 Tax=Marseillevirus LCMAC103 TaxID=2506604 RepID=A0A481YW10_9VIRU|nr:MAG: hypothetical protein LCMAC103_00630 [Marseillevirus LCMAC103]